ncbi:MAG: hypothetical protein RIE59_15000 [Imperialibacter sp.]
MNKLLLFAIFCLCPFAVAMAQLFPLKKEKQVSTRLEQPGRIEFEIANANYQNYIITGCEKEGLFICHKTEHKDKDGYNWEFIRLDTTLGIVWQKDMHLPFGSRITDHDYQPGFINYLIREKEYKQEELVLLRVNLENGDTSRFYINTVIPMVPTQFHVVGNTLLMGVYTDYKPFIFRYNLIDKLPQIIPGLYNDYGEILRITTDDRLRIFTVTMSERTPDLRTTVSVRSFSEGGDMMRNIHLEPDESKSLLNGAPTNPELDRQFVAGTYAHQRLTYSSGLYIARLSNSSQQRIDYFDYSELDHFFSYLSTGRERRIRERANQKKVLGQQPRFHYRLLLHDIIPNGNYYTVFGEAYYPSYSFGYHYTHAVVMTFDRLGNFLWDSSFEINDVTTFGARDLVHVGTKGDETVLLYLYDNTIRSKVLKEDKIIEGKTFNDISLTFEDDESWGGRNQVGNLSRWFGTTFYTYGIRDIENLHSEEAGYYRQVFYINKVAYR